MQKEKLTSSSILICGGRNYDNRKFFSLYMRCLPKMLANLGFPSDISEIITGDAGGADKLARWWAHKNNIPLSVFYAQWHIYGKTAGPMRNEIMAEEYPTVGVAFPGGKGTKDMTRRLIAKGIIIMQADESLTSHLMRLEKL